MREALIFVLAHEICSLETGSLTSATTLSPQTAVVTSDVVGCQRAARFLGRWFSRSGSPATVLGMLGVQP